MKRGAKKKGKGVFGMSPYVFEGGFVFRDVYCFPDEKEPAAYYYVPASPVPERDPSGLPTLTLWRGGQLSRLQLGVRWAAEEETLQALPAEIVRRGRDRRISSPGAVRLLPVRAEVDGAVLSIGDGSGRFAELQRVRSSGFPPYDALFNAGLDEEQADRAANALDGSPDKLKVAYLGRIRGPGGNAAPLEASADLAAWLPPGGAARHIRSLAT